MNLRSWVFSGSKVASLRSQVPGPGLQVSGLGSRSFQQLLQRMIKNDDYSVTSITEYDRKLLQSVAGITKCDRGITICNRQLLQSVASIINCDNYYKVRRNKSKLVMKRSLKPYETSKICSSATFRVT